MEDYLEVILYRDTVDSCFGSDCDIVSNAFDVARNTLPPEQFGRFLSLMEKADANIYPEVIINSVPHLVIVNSNGNVIANISSSSFNQANVTRALLDSVNVVVNESGNNSGDGVLNPDNGNGNDNENSTGTGGTQGNGFGFGNKTFWLILAAASAYKALDSDTAVGQIGFGGISAYALYEFVDK